MLESLKVIGDIFTEKKISLVKKNINNAYTNTQVSKVLSGEILNPKEIENKPKDNTAINLSTKKLLELQGLGKNDFIGKKVLDIGAGFSGLPFLLDGIKVEINIVDPLFLNNLSLEIRRNKNKIIKLIEEFDEKNYQHYKNGNTDKQEYLYRLNYEFNNILYDLSYWEKVGFTDNFNIGDTTVNIFPIAGEEAIFFDKLSLDYIFINHTITKNQVDPYILLQNSYSLLNKGGKLYITESGKFDLDFFKMVNNDFKLEVIDSNYLNKKTIIILEKL